MTDLRNFIAEFRAWCAHHRLSPRYVTKEALNNTRLIEAMERQAGRQEQRILRLRRWMKAYDADAAEREARERALKRSRVR